MNDLNPQRKLKSPKIGLRSTRLFSMQLADHDQIFAPRVRIRNRFWWLRLLLYAPALVLCLIPSYKIGRAILKNPGYTIPDSLASGDVFTLPIDEDDDGVFEVVPQIGGQTPPEIDSKKPLYFAVAGKNDLDVSFAFIDSDRPKIKALIEKMTHPEYAMFVKRVKVQAPEPALPASLLEEEAGPAHKGHAKNQTKSIEPTVKVAPPILEKEEKAYARNDGKIRLRCWKEPAVDAIGVDPLRPRRLVRLGTMNTAGPGEVVFAGTVAPSEAVVVVYHGGGLYTRYWGLRESRVQKGAKIAAGQSVGYTVLAAPKLATLPTWSAFFNPNGLNGAMTEVKAAGLLALSSQLCETK